MAVFLQVMRECCSGEGFRVCEWSVQSNHVHLICEAEGREALSRGMRRITIRLAKRWNRLWGRRGRVFAEAYHVVALGSVTQVRRALVYVLQNGRKHGVWCAGRPDPFSTGPVFAFWRDWEAGRDGGFPRAGARTWGLAEGWRRAGGGLPGVTELPGALGAGGGGARFG